MLSTLFVISQSNQLIQLQPIDISNNVNSINNVDNVNNVDNIINVGSGEDDVCHIDVCNVVKDAYNVVHYTNKV
jgi:hypothetical protein